MRATPSCKSPFRLSPRYDLPLLKRGCRACFLFSIHNCIWLWCIFLSAPHHEKSSQFDPLSVSCCVTPPSLTLLPLFGLSSIFPPPVGFNVSSPGFITHFSTWYYSHNGGDTHIIHAVVSPPSVLPSLFAIGFATCFPADLFVFFFPPVPPRCIHG